ERTAGSRGRRRRLVPAGFRRSGWSTGGDATGWLRKKGSGRKRKRSPGRSRRSGSASSAKRRSRTSTTRTSACCGSSSLTAGRSALAGCREIALKHAQQLRRGHDEQVRKALAESKAIAEKLVASPLRVKAKAGEDGRLFGSITANELAKQLQERSEGAIDRRQIHLAEPIRNLGTHEVTVRLHPEVSATVTVEVVRE